MINGVGTQKGMGKSVGNCMDKGMGKGLGNVIVGKHKDIVERGRSFTKCNLSIRYGLNLNEAVAKTLAMVGSRVESYLANDMKLFNVGI